MIDHKKISKLEWLSLAREYYTHLLEVMEGMSDREWRRRTRYLGWNCKDLVNHMTSAITINFNLLLQMALDGKPIPEPAFNLFLRNANEVARRRKNTVRQTIDEFRSEIFKLLDRFDSLTEQQWRMPAFFFVGDIDICNLFLAQLADNVVHERDLMIVNHRWQHFNPKYAAPLIDWFMCTFRPLHFRPEKASSASATVQFYITGNIGGEWNMKVDSNAATTLQGKILNPEITIRTDAEDLIATALARCAPWVGVMARRFEWLVKKDKREDYTAKVTGLVSTITGVLFGKIKIEGNKKKAKKDMEKWFWHFWERTEQ